MNNTGAAARRTGRAVQLVGIQGDEADLVTTCLPLRSRKFAHPLIGTHSRAIEGKLFEVLLGAGHCG